MRPLGSICRLRALLAVHAAILQAAALCAPASAHTPGVTLSGVGTATIDGSLGPGEWEGARCLAFDVNVPEGGTTPGAVCAMNDEHDLYLSVRFTRSALDRANHVSFEFDNDHRGRATPAHGDDIVSFSSDLGFADLARTTEPPCPPGVICGLYDTDLGGSSEGAGAIRNDGTSTVYEISHPLNSGDAWDFRLSPGDTVGLRQLNLQVVGTTIADTTYPRSLFSGDIKIRYVQAVQGKVIRVASGGHSGDSSCGADWTTPCDLQYALQTIEPGDAEVWVRGGTYKPTARTDRTSTFPLRSGVALYGGFGGTETARAERDPAAHPTRLSGDIGSIHDDGDNVFHVVDASGTDASAVLDGFTIAEGTASGPSFNREQRGGGIVADGGSPRIVDCTFADNTALQRGGAMYLSAGSSPLLDRCTFTRNSAASGGAIYNDLSSPTLGNCTVSGNGAASGGGIFNRGSSPLFSNCTLADNDATGRGGGMRDEEGSSPVLLNSILWGNSPDQVSESASSARIATGIVQGRCPDGSTCTEVRDADPRLAPLGNYGGASPTRLLRATSSAIDAGDDRVCASPPVAGASQNGLSRPAGAHCDIGAFEIGRLVVQSSGDLDGWVLESSQLSGRGGSVNAAATALRVGDDAFNRQYRGILSFGTQELPDAAVLTSATLSLRADGVTGTLPFGSHGRLVCDARKGFFSGNARLQATDFQAPPTLHVAAVVPRPAGTRWHAATLGREARAAIDAAGSTQLRLRFERGDDGNRRADYLSFSSGNAEPRLRPRLDLLYYVP